MYLYDILHRKEGVLPIDDVIRDYVKLAVDCDNYHANSKYCLAQLLHDNMDSPQGKALLASSTMRELW
jgi:tRNA-dihydrouridine synthase 2